MSIFYSLYFVFSNQYNFKIRRYLEIGKLYDSLGMKRLSTFYKWVSVVRVFKLIDKKLKYAIDNNLKCLVSRCSYQLKSLFDVMKIHSQKTPIFQINNSSIIMDKGFPLSKIHVVGQLVQLTSHNSKFDECIKYIFVILTEILIIH